MFLIVANRERCGFSDVGRIVQQQQEVPRLILQDRESRDHPLPIDLPFTTLFPKDRKLERIVQSRKPTLKTFDPVNAVQDSYPQIPGNQLITKAVERVLAIPAVGSKSFLITIADRTVGGKTVRDQMGKIQALLRLPSSKNMI